MSGPTCAIRALEAGFSTKASGPLDIACSECSATAGNACRPPKKRRNIKPRCYAGCGKPAQKGRRFCSHRCGREYAEDLVEGNDDWWCGRCREWHGIEAEDRCPDLPTPEQEARRSA